MTKRVRWTAAEDDVLRAVYPGHGGKAASAVLGRSCAGVTARALLLGIRHRRKTKDELRAVRRAYERRKGVADKRRRKAENIAAGLCKCGGVPKPKRRHCKLCLQHAKRWGYWNRYGVRPGKKCAFCSEKWAAPGSDFCLRHRRAGKVADYEPKRASQPKRRIQQMLVYARKKGVVVEARVCPVCDVHLVAVGTDRCRTCARHGRTVARVDATSLTRLGVGL